MLVSGPPLGITGGHCDNNLLPFEFHYKAEGVADGPWAAREKVREVIKYGADLIKVCASGGVLSKGDQPGTPQYSFEELQAIAEEAHKLGRKVAAHAHGTQSIKDAIRAGHRFHRALQPDRRRRHRARQSSTARISTSTFTTTISFFRKAQKPACSRNPSRKKRKSGACSAKIFATPGKSGTKMAFATDAGVYPHGDNAKQFAKMVEWGMKPIDAIQAATINAADLLGWSAKVGALETGHYADIIAVNGDPLADVRILESVKFVMKGGAVVRNDVAGK